MKTKTLWIATLAPLALAATACTSEPLGTDENESVASVDEALIIDELDIPAPANRNFILGDGFDSMTQSFKGTCVENSQTLPRAPGSGAVIFDREMTASQVDTMFGMSTDVKARYGAYNASVRAAFTRSTQSRRTSINVVFGATYDSGTLRFKESGAHVVGNTANWYTRCGDGFVSQIAQGGDLAILYRMDFASEADKSAFSASIGGNYAGIVSGDADVQRAAAQFRGRVAVHVEAHQVGGDVTRLASILDADDGHAALNCDIDNLAACNNLVAHGIHYAAHDFADSVRSQPGNRSYIIKDWSQLSVAPTSVTQAVPADIIAVRNKLAELFEDEMEVQDRLASLSRSDFTLAANDVALVASFRTKSNANMAVLKNIVKLCFDQLDPTVPATMTKCKASIKKAGPAGLTAAGYVTLDVGELDFPLDGETKHTVDGQTRDDVMGYITVGEGRWGTWRGYQYCPPGEYGIGYRMRVEEPQGNGNGGADDSALNAVRINCARVNHASAGTTIVSYEGLWGDWNPYMNCTNGVLRGGKMKIESYQHGGDDSGANSVAMTCTDGSPIQAPGGGQWGEWNDGASCPAGTAVCGINSRFEKHQGDGDDTAMNGMMLACCAF